jgi:(S)-citramalyl-CoA lyase
LRINGLDTRAGISDLEALLGSSAVPDFIVLPKTETIGHLQILDRLLTSAGKGTRLIGLIESAHGLAAAEAIATATPRLVGLMLGAADMAADLGATTAWEPLAFARGRLIAACALAGVSPIDAPFFNLHDEAGLKQEAVAAVGLGFSAKAAIHPAQIGAINAALTPSAEAVEKARAILAENAKGVGTVDGQMIDEAVARKARRTLASAGLQA